jgi:hypothetical protein
MASSVVAQRAGASRASCEREILGQGPPAIGIARRDTASTTGSGIRMPLGHWTLPVSGNCPGCNHHHKSVEIHVKNVNNTSELVDLHCEKCNKLWLGPGNKNSTRLSLVSNVTLDPPPMEPEVRVTLAQMIRFTTRVATLSSLPDIQEGVQLPHSTALPKPPPAQRMPNRIVKPNTKDVRSTHPKRFLLRFNQRLEKTFPILRSTRLGRRLMSPKDECNTNMNTHPISTPPKPVPNSHAASFHGNEESCQYQNEVLLKEMEPCGPPAIPTQGLQSRMIVDQNVINDMRPEQRIALLRSQITTFTARHKAQSAALSKVYHKGEGIHRSDSLATLEAIRNSLLTGIGAFDTADEWDEYRESNPATNRPISSYGTNMSEALTAVESTGYAPGPYLNITLHRQPRQAGPVRRSSAQSDVLAWQQSRQDQGDLQLSLESNDALSAGVGVLTTTRTHGDIGHSSSQSQIYASPGEDVTRIDDSNGSAPLPPLPRHAYREWD